MRYDFADVQDEKTYASIPEGTYEVTIAEVRSSKARDGSARWGLRLDVADGEYAGRIACFDNLTWSDRGVSRVKLVLGVLGFDVSGTLEVEPDDLMGRQARVQVVRESWEDENAVRQTRNTVPFRGWLSSSGKAPEPSASLAYEPGPQETPF